MKTVFIFSFLFFLITLFSFSSFIKKKTVIFFGDSITQAAVKEDGYIDLLNTKLNEADKGDEYELIGAGISGNKVPDLQRRLKDDVLSKNPDLVFIYIGINDVWHFAHPCCRDSEGGTSVELFEAGLVHIITKIKEAGGKVVVCTPTVIGEKSDSTNPQDKMLDQYADISRRVAKSTNSQLCDLRESFVEYLKENNPENLEEGILTTDGVHLNKQGNELVAEEMKRFL